MMKIVLAMLTCASIGTTTASSLKATSTDTSVSTATFKSTLSSAATSASTSASTSAITPASTSAATSTAKEKGMENVPESWKYSYIIPILYKLKVKCSGVLISQIHVLVSLQCFSSFVNNTRVTKIKGYYVCLAFPPWGENFETWDIDALHGHPDFYMSTQLNRIRHDIGIALVNREDDKTLQVIEAPLRKGPLTGKEEPEVLGFRNSRRFSPLTKNKKNFMKFLNFELREKSVCELYVGKLFYLDANQICTKRTIIHDSTPMKGDVLVDRHVVLGILTFSTKVDKVYAVYTDVSKYSKYIKDAKEALKNPSRHEGIILC